MPLQARRCSVEGAAIRGRPRVYTGASRRRPPRSQSSAKPGSAKRSCLQTNQGVRPPSRAASSTDLQRVPSRAPAEPEVHHSRSPSKTSSRKRSSSTFELAVRPCDPKRGRGQATTREHLALPCARNVSKGVRALTHARTFRLASIRRGASAHRRGRRRRRSTLPTVSGIAKAVLGEDPLAGVPGLSDYLARMAERPTVRRVYEDRKADLPSFYAVIRRSCLLPALEWSHRAGAARRIWHERRARETLR